MTPEILTDDDVRLIRAAADERRRLMAEAAKLSAAALAEKFGVSRFTIENIIARKSRGKVQ